MNWLPDRMSRHTDRSSPLEAKLVVRKRLLILVIHIWDEVEVTQTIAYIASVHYEKSNFLMIPSVLLLVVVGRSVWYIFHKGREVTLLCSYCLKANHV